ncbi:hypothetical protein SADUNF_Sadunf16G0207600 [Salix dunnii]|uniref:MADS-box domain-containing protein n=1 Tax=Salix dunnii TaxID=1413687 RepID=A0A835JB22_9ROSI|nr:hypothetical protein SADUNF_Sadunf16G0207600 [Salix dunnii]
MELIRNEKSRMHTFRKRKTNLLKKVSDFSILCGVDACVIIFGPNQNDQPAATAETWPSNLDEVRCIINRYRACDQPRKCYQGSDYFTAKKKKIDAEFAKLHRQVLKSKYPIWDDRLNRLSIYQLRAILAQLDTKIESADKTLSFFKEYQYVILDSDASWMPASSQRCQNISHEIQKHRKRNDNSNDNMDSTDFLQLVSNWKSFEAQLPIPFQPEMISHMATPDENSLNERTYNNGYSTLYSEPKPLSVFPPAHYESKQSVCRTPSQTNITEDATMKMMMSYQSHNDSFGCQASSSNNQYLSCNGPFYVNPASWTLDNVWFNNDVSSVRSVAPTMQPMQLPVTSFPQQSHFSEINEFNGNAEFDRRDYS